MSTLWYYAQEGQQAGPVSLDKLKAMTETGELVPTDLVWNSGMPSWVAASSIPELFPPPPPMPMAKVRLYDKGKGNQFKVYLDGNFVTESPVQYGAAGFDCHFEVAPGSHVLEVIWYYGGEKDRKKFVLKLPRAGKYEVGFQLVVTQPKNTLKKGWLVDTVIPGPPPPHPMENSTLDIVELPS